MLSVRHKGSSTDKNQLYKRLDNMTSLQDSRNHYYRILEITRISCRSSFSRILEETTHIFVKATVKFVLWKMLYHKTKEPSRAIKKWDFKLTRSLTSKHQARIKMSCGAHRDPIVLVIQRKNLSRKRVGNENFFGMHENQACKRGWNLFFFFFNFIIRGTYDHVYTYSAGDINHFPDLKAEA